MFGGAMGEHASRIASAHQARRATFTRSPLLVTESAADEKYKRTGQQRYPTLRAAEDLVKETTADRGSEMGILPTGLGNWPLYCALVLPAPRGQCMTGTISDRQPWIYDITAPGFEPLIHPLPDALQPRVSHP